MINAVWRKVSNELSRWRTVFESAFVNPYSHLFIVSDEAGWVLDEEARELEKVAQAIGYKARTFSKLNLNISQVIHYTSQFSLLSEKIYQPKNRISIDYFHGKPEQGESFTRCFDALRKHHSEISRIRVSNFEMEEVIKSTGIDPDKVRRIPIGINLNYFQPQTNDTKISSRLALGIPVDAKVIGSFQKDGVGWGNGDKPKLIKGPDMFLEVISLLKEEIPNLWVLLSGPARGYVKKGLEDIGVPYRHVYEKEYGKVSYLYDALDLYLITSREEGGPKACLEAMAKGIPLVTTAVGQCRDLVKNEKNGMMVAIDDEKGLRDAVLKVVNDNSLRLNLVVKGIETARKNTYEAQMPLWSAYFKEVINY